mmetsp:Transcript_9390/g.31415  ORF Transcript_9390/g.31415 Transcript_9390/m.31415 type:complete len:736 (-) Transcript_9390:1429-3636(-)
MSLFKRVLFQWMVLATLRVCSGHIAPEFINVGVNCTGVSSNCFVTPPNDHVFWGQPGDQIKFFSAMRQDNPSDQGSQYRGIFFEINSTFYNSKAVNVGSQGLSIPAFMPFPNDVTKGYREFTATLVDFAPSNDLRVCFQALVDCRPTDEVTCPVSQVAYSGLKQVLGRQTCCIVNPDGSYNTNFYPKRCVNLYVAVPPQIVAISPADDNMCSTRRTILPLKSWEKPVSVCDVTVNNGQLLRLNIDAVDMNREDDIDVHATGLPNGAVLGPRMCCDENFTACHELPMGSMTETTECTNPCFSEASGYAFSPKCGSVCTMRYARNPCRFVRRQLLFQPGSNESKVAQVVSIQAYAQDDSSRLDTNINGLCCHASNLKGNATEFSVTAQYNNPALIEPLPPTRLPDAYVNCPIPVFGVHAFSVLTKNFSDLQIVPEGCVFNSYTLAEGCPDQSLCTVCLPAITCTNAQCKFPVGIDIGSNLPYIWNSYELSSHSSVYDAITSYYIIKAYYNKPSNSLLNLAVYSNIVPANGTVLVVEGVQPSSPSMSKVSCLLDDKIGLSTQWVNNALRIVLNLEKSTGLTPLKGINVTCHFEESFSLPSPNVSYDSSLVGGLKFSKIPVPLTQCSMNCDVHALGDGSRGVGVYRAIRWTPKKGQEGKDYSLCFRAVDTKNISAVASFKCFNIRVVKCKYCALPGDSYTSLAKLFFTDWFQIWSSNPNLGGNPDAIAPGRRAGILCTD